MASKQPKQVLWISIALAAGWIAITAAINNLAVSLPKETAPSLGRVELISYKSMQVYAAPWEADLIQWGPWAYWLFVIAAVGAAHLIFRVRQR